MKRRFTEDSWRKEPWFKGLVSAFLSRRNEEQMANFLRDIGTLSELAAWSERLEVARLLGQGLSYRQVSAKTGASTTTVTRVAHFLENGEGGYRDILKVHRHQEMRKKKIGAVEMGGVLQENVDTEISLEPSPKPKERDKTMPVTPLQKYLQRP